MPETILPVAGSRPLERRARYLAGGGTRGRQAIADAIRRELRQADRILLALDYDGTLAPIAERPEEAAAAPETIALLRDLAQLERVSVAIISGRSLADLKSRLPQGITLAGNHGLEVEGGGISYVHPGAEILREVLDHACWDLEAALEAVRGAFIERKGLTATVHYRQSPPDLYTWIQATVEAAIAPYQTRFFVKPALKAWEIRPRVPWNKGSVIKLLLERLTAERPALICAGDDATDEDMFKAAPGAISIRVGRSRRTRARYYVRGTEDLLRFLQLVAKDIGDAQCLDGGDAFITAPLSAGSSSCSEQTQDHEGR